jgi:hypothetical protein
MNLFDTEQQTDDEKLDAQIGAIKKQAVRAINRFKQNQNQIFNMIWNNYQFTPQQIFDKFGSSAVELFVVSKAAEDYQALALGDSYTPLVVPYEFVVNADGTVTVGDKIVIEDIVDDIEYPEGDSSSSSSI